MMFFIALEGTLVWVCSETGHTYWLDFVADFWVLCGPSTHTCLSAHLLDTLWYSTWHSLRQRLCASLCVHGRRLGEPEVKSPEHARAPPMNSVLPRTDV